MPESQDRVASSSLVRAAGRGCYPAPRAAALAGVPISTVYWWARHEVVVPSVSATSEKLWSYSDLLALRVVAWLRRRKGDNEPKSPASPMPRVRQALALVDELGLDLWAADSSPLSVDASGAIFISVDDQVLTLDGQPTLLPAEALQLTWPFGEEPHRGPNLLRPRPQVVIVPAKVSGEPHVENTRITTLTLAALDARGFSTERIAQMYDVDPAAVDDAISLEQQLGTLPLAA